MLSNYFSLAAFFLVFREVLEACLVVGVVLAYLNRTGATQLRRYVWIGAGAGASTSVIIGSIFVGVYYSRREQLFRGRAEHIFEGVTFLLACALLSWMVVWMLTTGKKIQVSETNDELLDFDNPKAAKMGVFTMVFLQVLREGIEAFIFLTGASGATSRKDGWRALPIPGILGVITAITVAFLVFRGLLRLDLVKFFAISSIVMIFFAAGLISHAMHELQEAGLFGEWDVEMNRPWWNQILWSTKECCDDKNNELFAFCRSLLGYQDTPTFVEITSYCLYFFIVIILFIRKIWSNIRIRKNLTASVTKPIAISVFSFGFVAFILGISGGKWNALLVGSLLSLIGIALIAFTFDMIVSWMSSVLASKRRIVTYVLGILLGIMTLLMFTLHIAQMVCDDKRNSCSLPRFYYFGMIFQEDWVVKYRSLAILTISMWLTIYLGTFSSILVCLFACNVSSDNGDYLYEKDEECEDELEIISDEYDSERSTLRITRGKSIKKSHPLLI